MNEREERRRQLVIPRSNAPEIFEALEKPLDSVSVFVDSFVVFLLVSLVFTRRNDRKSTMESDIHENFRGIVSPVAKNTHTLFDDMPHQRNGLSGIMRCSCGNDESHRSAAAVNYRVYLRGQAASAAGDFPIGFGEGCIILPLHFEFFLYPRCADAHEYMCRLFGFRTFLHGSALFSRICAVLFRHLSTS